ncbi:Ionotropic receptor 138 [Cephus cinctus]|uniref:Uncharacterized protein LOC112494030 n=1 Tax=Cephus cinctus TaxID=211228 RepID=A0A3L9LTB5_CEPCN|nr:uncharacterized protein LOC112494030 [Cephus cinctus]RLZ02176.1 Ionotropic receptor 138 [Cephus cinctus]
MIWLRYFICILLFSYSYTVLIRNPEVLSRDLERNEKERLLEKFLMDANSHLMQNCPSRQTSIIAPKDQLLRDATQIFKSRPFFVGTNSEVIVQSLEYAEENCVFVFVDTIDYDYLSTTFSHLPSNYDTKVHITSTTHVPVDEVNNIFNLMYEKSFENVIFTFLDHNVFKAFQAFYYTTHCRREIRISYVWRHNSGLEKYYYHDHYPRNLNKCSVPISTLPTRDSITIREYSNGTLRILGGLEGNLILMFAEKLNFTAAVKYPEIRVRYGTMNDNTTFGLVGDIANIKSKIAIGKLMWSVKRRALSDATASYNHECVVWTIPIITAASTGGVLYSEFHEYPWAAILMSIIFSCFFIHSISRITSGDREKKTFIEVTLDVICSTLGIPLHRVPGIQPAKIYYFLYIFYAMVVTVAYRTSLASILVVRNNVQLIKSVEDIIRLGLIPGGNNNTLFLLKDQQKENSYMSYVIKHYEVIPDLADALDRIKQKKDLAYIKHLSTLQYYKRNLTLSGEEIHFDWLDYCILSYHSVVLVVKGSALTKELSRIIIRLKESGFIQLWNSANGKVDTRNTYVINTKTEKLTLPQLQSIFLFYISGIVLSVVTVILEIIFHTFFRQRQMTH